MKIKKEVPGSFEFFCPGTSGSENVLFVFIIVFLFVVFAFSSIFLSVAGCIENFFFLNVITEINFYY